MAVQNRTRRNYNDEEVESLQTVAMVLAELVAGGELIDPKELLPADGLATAPLRLEGLRLNGGIGIRPSADPSPPIFVLSVSLPKMPTSNKVDCKLRSSRCMALLMT